jgi:hypothetical protein
MLRQILVSGFTPDTSNALSGAPASYLSHVSTFETRFLFILRTACFLSYHASIGSVDARAPSSASVRARSPSAALMQGSATTIAAGHTQPVAPVGELDLYRTTGSQTDPGSTVTAPVPRGR